MIVPQPFQYQGSKRGLWQGEKVAQYDKLKAEAAKLGLDIPQYVKEVLARVLK
jgi:hypothetical protein